jgi:DNA-binding NarL/FixJ family response regulator
MKPVNILLVDDHTIVREGLRKLLDLSPDLAVVGEAQDGNQAIFLAKSLQPAVILMDISMPRLNGLEATRNILKDQPAIQIIILSAHSDDAYVRQAFAVGARGFLQKQTSAHEICRAIRKVMSGESFFSRRVDRPRDGETLYQGPPHARPPQLTGREFEVLQLIAEGTANKESAAVLGISIKTVEKHREHLMKKLDIHDTAGLTRYAISSGIIECRVHTTVMSG